MHVLDASAISIVLAVWFAQACFKWYSCAR